MQRIVGISPWSPRDNPDYGLMKEAGIEWIRETVDFPVFGEQYEKTLERMRKAKEAGMRIGCVSPIPAGYQFVPEKNRTDYVRHAPDSWGEYGDESFYENTYEMCRRIGEDTRGLVELWQVSNEMDIREFCGRMTLEQAGRYLLASAEGLRAGNPDPELMLGINPCNIRSPEALYFYDLLYKQHDGLLTYVGGDGYYGTWSEGKVQDWVEVIDYLYELTGYPVFINEWGYNSSGGEAWPQMGPADRPCNTGHFKYVWRERHDEKEQADYFAAGTRLLLTYPNCIGFFMYSWGDDGVCWYCGKKGCPGESTWGITDGQNHPKLAYYAVKENVLKYNK
ncbi:MAG: hypothetical protein IKR59_03675 [Lachnospiraceae bacterium]|nr:hypothetical protein [Lachnospiraceae bacterium]